MESIRTTGIVHIKGKHYHNQVTDSGIKKILTSLSTIQPLKITNILLLKDFAIPVGKTAKQITFADVQSHIAKQSFVGNNGVVNADESRDFRSYISAEPPYELTIIGTIPEDRAIGEVYNAACLIVNGDDTLSTSTAVS